MRKRTPSGALWLASSSASVGVAGILLSAARFLQMLQRLRAAAIGWKFSNLPSCRSCNGEATEEKNVPLHVSWLPCSCPATLQAVSRQPRCNQIRGATQLSSRSVRDCLEGACLCCDCVVSVCLLFLLFTRLKCFPIYPKPTK